MGICQIRENEKMIQSEQFLTVGGGGEVYWDALIDVDLKTVTNCSHLLLKLLAPPLTPPIPVKNCLFSFDQH